MELTPGEKAVLRQISVLYSTAGARDQQVKALLMQWPPTHYEAYQKAYGGLVEKRLIQDEGTQSFRITDAGLRAIGVVPRPSVQVSGLNAARPAQRVERKRNATAQLETKRGVFSRLVTGLLGKKSA
jgi:hypothetical protein